MAKRITTREALETALTVGVADYCALLGVSHNTARAAIRRGDIPCIRLNRTLRIPAAHVRAVLGIAQPGDVDPTPGHLTGWASQVAP